MKQRIIGVYDIGHEQVELVLCEGTGGEFNCIPEHGHIPRIKIGADYSKWRDVASVLYHESFEFVLQRMGCRFECDADCGGDSAGYTFILTHVQLSDACARVAMFTTAALPELAKIWKGW